MPHIFDPEDRHKLDNPERRAAMPPDQTLVKAGLKPGDIVLDIGCGMGYFAIPASRMVGPRGMIYAVDASGIMLAELRSRTSREGIFNIRTFQTKQSELELPEAEYTLALLANVLHEVDDKKAFLAGLAAALKPGARLSVIEWKKAETPAGPPLKERLSEDEVQVMLKKAGFTEPRTEELSPSSVLYTCSRK